MHRIYTVLLSNILCMTLYGQNFHEIALNFYLIHAMNNQKQTSHNDIVLLTLAYCYSTKFQYQATAKTDIFKEYATFYT